ncbi:MAG: YgaP family membrane protein [Minisyncoccia bacterium]
MIYNKTNVVIIKYWAKQNIGKTDKIIRLILGLILGYFAWTLTGTISIVLYIVAFILLVTALIGFCPLYVLLKINTYTKKTSSDNIQQENNPSGTLNN